MRFEWDEAKRQSILTERGLDFEAVDLFVDGRPVIREPTPRNNEERWKSTLASSKLLGCFSPPAPYDREESAVDLSRMSKRSENIVKRTAAELRARRQRGETKVDWKAAAIKPLPSGSDPDDAMDEIDWATTELPAPRRKQHTTLRLDADVLEWFRGQGRGYQTKINAILRSYFEQHTR